jgi:hypothetical protein
MRMFPRWMMEGKEYIFGRNRTHGLLRSFFDDEKSARYCADEALVKSGFDGEHTEPNHRLMYT